MVMPTLGVGEAVSAALHHLQLLCVSWIPILFFELAICLVGKLPES